MMKSLSKCLKMASKYGFISNSSGHINIFGQIMYFPLKKKKRLFRLRVSLNCKFRVFVDTNSHLTIKSYNLVKCQSSSESYDQHSSLKKSSLGVFTIVCWEVFSIRENTLGLTGLTLSGVIHGFEIFRILAELLQV